MSLTTATAAAAVARGDSGAAAAAHGCLLSRELQPPSQQHHIRAIDELQDGDTSSLEPGEVVTPPHLNHDDAAVSPAPKKVPTKDAKSKTLRKLAQIDTDGGKVRALLEQRDAGSRRKEGKSSTPRALENGTARAPSEDPDDSEGLYSDTDSSGEEQRNVEDVQQARKEKQAEAAAAAMPQAAPPVGPPFLGHNPLRFHMRPPFCEFPRMGFLPRMPRGGLRMRPPFFNRPPSRMGAPNMSGAPPSGSYGPALPPSAQGASGSSTGPDKQLKSDLDWTTTEPPIQFNFNLVPDCSIAQHKACQEKAESTAKKPQHTLKSKEPASDALRNQSKGKHKEKSANEKDGERAKEKNGEATKERNRKSSKDKQRERSKEKHGDRSKEKSRDKSKEKSRDKSKEKLRDKSKEKSRDNVKEKSREVSKEGRRERSKERHKEKTKERTRERSKDKVRERSKDKLRERSKEKPRDMPKELPRELSKDRHREISNDRHREMSKDRHREMSKDRHRAKSKETKPSEMPRARSKDDKNDVRRPKESSRDEHTSHAERARDISKDNHRERESKEQRSRDGMREQSAERQREAFKDNRPRPRSREKSTAKCSKESSKDDKSRERAGEEPSGSEKEKPGGCSKEKEKPSGSSKEKEKPSGSSKEKDKPPRDKKHERTKTRSRSRNHSPESEDRTPPLTPPRDFLLPPAAAASDVDASDMDEKPRGLDIFAESPPRLHTATQLATVPQRSTTPPLIVAPVAASNKAAPLLKASEIHSRIGALLEDNDLHLEALLATKEQLLRRTNEHKERKEAPKMEIKAEMQQQQQAAAINSDWESADLNQVVPRRMNPFRKQESVLNERRSTSRAASSLGNGGNAWPYRSQSRERQRSDEYKEVSIKIERNISPTPLPMPMIDVSRIKLERNVTPPLDTEREVLVRNGAVAANAPPPTAAVAGEQQESPDTDDYIDNWENDDSLSSMPKTAAAANAPPSAAVRPLSSSIDEATASGDSNEDDTNDLWNAKSTPPPKAKQRQPAIPLDGGASQEHLVNIYDKFMNSINMSSEEGQTAASKNSSLSNSTAETETSSGSESESTSSSSSDDDEEESSTADDDEGEGEEEEDDAVQQEAEEAQLAAEAALLEEEPPEKEQQQQTQLQQKKNNVSKDLRKLKSLEDNLARIQMMRENYDSGDEISEELLKMESLFLMQRNAIMDKYRKQELKSQQEVQQKQEPRSPTPVNSIFDDNREAIKLTLSPLKLTRKPAIFDNDETEHPQQQQQAVKVKLEEGLRPPIGTSVRRPKEIAIVKPTIVETRNRLRIPRSATGRERTRSRSPSRNRERSFRRGSVRPNRVKDSSRSPSPRPRWRPPSPRRGIRLAKKPTIKRSHSKSVSRSRTRSRSPKRSRKRFQKVGASRRRVSVSPGPVKPLRPRSPKVHRRRSYSRERERSPLPFRPPSPPMRRSWSSSHSHSRSPTRRRSQSRTRSNSRSRSRSPFDGRREEREFADYFGEDQSLEAATYYYNMSLLHGEATGEDYETYAAYIDSAYHMEQAYAQLSEAMDMPAAVYGEYGALMETSPVLRELPKAHTPAPELLDTKPIKLEPEEIKDAAAVVPAAMSVAVRKGNVLEIVPTSNESEAEDRKPRKRVSFVDSVKPNYESDGEDRVIVSRVVERAMQQYQQRRAEAAARLQRLRDELLAAPPPPPPVTPKPPDQEKAVLVQKKSKMRYFHLDPLKREIVMSRSRVMRAPVPRFDRKHFEMLVKTGRLPPLPHGFLRHRPPLLPPNADAATKAAMLKEYFSKHPPPTPRMQLRMPMRLPMGMPLPVPMRMPMGMPMRMPLIMHEGGMPMPMHEGAMPMPMHNGVPYFLSGPPPSSPPVSMPIPVLGAHLYHTYPQPAPMMPAPSPGLLPIPVLSVPDVIASATPSPVPFFTPPPLPTFTVQPVPTIREIMPVDILQKIGPLPKTLDLDGGSTPRADEVKLEIKEEPLGEEQLLVESQ
ncbi:serine/arginine repetitive matrix protein 2 isoform X1 [Drosophila subobscura]|uniref:serine/arginine repetitive matrix protein 2 isoform X1 n=1 Tax=Drosophila subobscura TaxID=7241 RepID=UPI00155B355E|nr:serine/arginine repetitive matrix protein 2 isoform X1 [Drosophila subobscura]XP_034659022.1 serine/arginine repetitive matrix protein 2 isoform X1 [Drosophila subobscura]